MDFRKRLTRGLAGAAVAASLLSGIGSATAAALEPPDSGPLVSEAEAIRVARGDPKAAAAFRSRDGLRISADRATDGDWEVGIFDGDTKIVEVVVNDVAPVVEESWGGYQVAWKMARGYEGAFGRTINAPYIWLPLCAAFVLGLLDWRRLRRVAHVDLVVIVAGFGLSHWFFNRGDIGASVPLAYLPLLWLGGRMLWLAFRGGEGLRPSIPAVWLAVAAVAIIGVRVGLNATDSNVIDVGYAGVIGADRIADGDPIYGNFPEDNHAGDTYGPVSYYAYVPFEQAEPWSGRWDDLPAAHGAAVFFDLVVICALFLLGRRLRGGGRRGNELGVMLAFGWAACPYTAYVLESNTNDALVSALLVGCLIAAASPAARGVAMGLAGMTKFAPLVLAPLFAAYRPPGAAPGRKPVVIFTAAVAVTVAVVSLQALLDPGFPTFYERTIENQLTRDSPFSIWGQVPALAPLQSLVKWLTLMLALGAAFYPRRRDLVTIAALGAAILIAIQLTVEHWFYLYIPWFLPLLLVALLARETGGPVTRQAS